MTFNALYNLRLGYLKICLSPYELACSSKSLGEIPPLSEVCLWTQERFFLVVAPQIWNSLLPELRLRISLLIFQQCMKTFVDQEDVRLICPITDEAAKYFSELRSEALLSGASQMPVILITSVKGNRVSPQARRERKFLSTLLSKGLGTTRRPLDDSSKGH